MLHLVFGWLVLLLISVSACRTTPEPSQTTAEACVETRAALDVGSGSTKLKVAKVDVCQLRLGEALFEAQEKVSYQDDLQASGEGTLSAEVLANGVAALRKLKNQAEPYRPKAIVAIATSAFRKAKNGADAAAALGRDAGLTIRVISQSEEGQVGFLGAVQKAPRSLDHIAVWDVGGGSQQITTRDTSGQFHVFESQLASVSFKDHLVKTIQRRPAAASPNPISKSDSVAGTRYVREQLAGAPAALKTFLAAKDTQVMGIGGVHFHSVRGQVGSDSYDQKAVGATLTKRLGLTDAQVGGDFPATDVSNLVLIGGTMEVLGIKDVTAVNVNLADGAMLHSEFWGP